jgi:hypothetical protein
VRLGTAVIALACIFASLIGAVTFAPLNARVPQKLTLFAELPQIVAERPQPSSLSPCLSENWPNLSPNCLKRAGRADTVADVRRVMP